jgi:hypothetical protein
MQPLKARTSLLVVLTGLYAFVGPELTYGQSGDAAAANPARSKAVSREAKRSEAKKITEPDYKVVFWFDGQEFRYQAYDVRKGQFTQAVQDWVDYKDVDASGYIGIGRLATVRRIYLAAEKGETEKEKLASAIERELARIEDFDVSKLQWNMVAQRPFEATPLRPLPGGLASPGALTERFDPPSVLMPQPFPYTRPRP